MLIASEVDLRTKVFRTWPSNKTELSHNSRKLNPIILSVYFSYFSLDENIFFWLLPRNLMGNDTLIY